MQRARLALLLAIGSGGALGTLARYGVNLSGDIGPRAFPWPTFAVNVSGAFLLGLALTLLEDRFRPASYLRAFVAIGLLGGYTTFSTWTVQAVLLVRHHAPWMAATYALLTPIAGLAAVYVGVAAGRAWPAGGGGAGEGDKDEARRHR